MCRGRMATMDEAGRLDRLLGRHQHDLIVGCIAMKWFKRNKKRVAAIAAALLGSVATGAAVPWNDIVHALIGLFN